jgi:hypothetical protein
VGENSEGRYTEQGKQIIFLASASILNRMQQDPAQLLSPLHFSSFHLLHFRTPYLLFNLHLQEGRLGNAWEPSWQNIKAEASLNII